MTERGPGGEPPEDEGPSGTTEPTDIRERLGNPTRLMPRRTPSPVLEPEVVAAEPEIRGSDQGEYLPPSGERHPNPLFAPRSFGDGRIQVWGCSPGCLIASLVASVVLTILLNIVF
jgi:hypothetical protein